MNQAGKNNERSHPGKADKGDGLERGKKAFTLENGGHKQDRYCV